MNDPSLRPVIRRTTVAGRLNQSKSLCKGSSVLSLTGDSEMKVQDVVGLYLDPPDKALVLAVDEKSQIQALDRTQPGLPIKKGAPAP